MFRTAFDRSALGSAALVAIACAVAGPVAAQEAQPQPSAPEGARITSSEIALSSGQAELKLELANGQRYTLATVTSGNSGLQQNRMAGSADQLTHTLTLGVQRGDELDDSWRELLEQAQEASPDELAKLLIDWEPPASSGQELDLLLESALTGAAANLPVEAAPGLNDSLGRLQERIQELESTLENVEHEREAVQHEGGRRDRGFNPLRHIGRGIAGILSVLVTFAVLFGIGFALVFFGGRPYLDTVADAARHATLRSFLVGLAAAFLVFPAFIIGCIVLAISIVGIPVLLLWIPVFPLAVVLGIVFGYLAVAHASGEAFAERRFYGEQWVSRANSYYYLLTGLGLLLVLFIASHVVEMLGPWLGFIHGTLMFLGIVLTWAAAIIGFGAVLITRAGTRPLRRTAVSGSERFDEAPVT